MVPPADQRTEAGFTLTSPAAQGWRLPAEWEPHSATWLTWPRRDGISFPGLHDRIPPIFATIVRTLSQHEAVCINVWDVDMEEEARNVLKEHDALQGPVHFHHHPAYEPWCRDHGPLFLTRSNELAVADWEYNAWGGKYPPFELDNQIPDRIARLRGAQHFPAGMVLEGGAIDSNGQGTLLTTESCLLNPNRNPSFDRAAIEARLRDFLGAERIVWLSSGIAGDDTDGHVDNLARFVSSDTIVAVVEPDPADENHQPLQDNLRRLNADNPPFRVIELPLPRPVFHEGERLPASYANFYIANNVVLVPAFSDPADSVAREILQPLFRTREVVTLDSRDLAWGLGSFHCLTMQEPDPAAHPH